MSSTVIREVEGQPIYLTETTLTQETVWTTVAYIVPLLVIGLAVLLAVIQQPFGRETLGISIPIGFIGVMGLLFVPIFGWGNKQVPAYRIWIVGDSITIPRTTPEADQAAVCKAANELERKILERRKKERELERIAGNCK